MDDVYRMILSNQFLILSKIDTKNSAQHLENYEIIKSGFAYHYDEVSRILHEETSDDDCLFVRKVLSLYDRIGYSYRKWEKSEGITEEDVRFPGFSGNSDPRLIKYAEFLMKDGFSSVIVTKHGLDSHHENRDVYNRMLDAEKSIPARSEMTLTVSEFRKLQESRKHPNNP